MTIKSNKEHFTGMNTPMTCCNHNPGQHRLNKKLSNQHGQSIFRCTVCHREGGECLVNND